MKLIISLIFLISLRAQAHKILILNSDSEESLALNVKGSFINTYEIPETLIQVKKISHCPEAMGKKRYLILCIDKKKELVVLNTSSQIIKTLNVFKRL